MKTSSRRMTLRGGLLLLSLVLGDVPTILAAAQTFGFIPTKIDKGEGIAGINVNPGRLLDIAYSIHEKSSKFLKEHQQEPESSASQPNAEMTAHSDIPPYGYNSMENNRKAEKQPNVGNSSPTLLDNPYDSSYHYDTSNEVSGDFDDYDGGSNEELIGYSQCNEDNGAINCRYVSNYKMSEKNETPAKTNTSLISSNVGQLNSTVSNFDNTVHNNSAIMMDMRASVNVSGNNTVRANNDTIIIRNVTAVFDTTENPVHEKAPEATTESTKASTSIAREEQFPALKALTKPRRSYEYLLALERSKTDYGTISDYSISHKPSSLHTPHQAYHEPRWNSPARNMCISCGPNAYCDISLDPYVCVCLRNYRGVPPDCYMPSADEMLWSYRILLGLKSDENISSTNSPITVQSKKQDIQFVVQGNKDSASPKE